jgi:hypothetical protein
MENSSLVLAITKLAAAGEQAGFTLEQMIGLLDAGLEVETLMELICWRLHGVPLPPVASGSSSCWVVHGGSIDLSTPLQQTKSLLNHIESVPLRPH